MSVDVTKELQFMQEAKEKAIKEWRAYDIPTIDSIIDILEKYSQNEE